MRRQDAPPPLLQVLQDGFNWRALHAGKPREKLLDGGTVAEIFKQCGRHVGASKCSRPTAFLRVTLYGTTILPLLHTLPSCSI
jgi:hypothetical protein